VEDRVRWLHAHRELVGGLRFADEPKVLRFFVGRLEPVGDWPQRLVARFREEFGDSL
jgi:tryptophanase